MSRQANVSLHKHSHQLPTGHLPCQPGYTKPPESLHDLKSISVWEFITMRPNLYLSHLFLPLWHCENFSQSFGGSLAFLHPIHHKSSLQWMDHFRACPLVCSLPLSGAASVHCSRLTVAINPLHKHTSPRTLVDHFFLVLALKELTVMADGQ